jgi:hypothetical protein
MKKEIGWAAPKQLQKCREFTKWFSKRKKPCKVTKGEHEFKLVSSRKLTWINETLEEYRCPCGKKLIKFKENE